MFKKFYLLACFLTASFASIASDPANLSEQDDAKIRLFQRAVRNWNDQIKPMYEEACNWRDGKIEGFKENSIKTNINAGVRFMLLAYWNHPKAQYNLGRIYYGLREDEMAEKWLQRALKNGVDQAEESLQKLHARQSKYLLTLFSDDNLFDLINGWENNALVSFRAVSKRPAKIVESVLAKRSEIISLLTFDKHPYPHTISYFVRDLQEKIPDFLKTQKDGFGDFTEEQVNQIFKISTRYFKCGNFCKSWGYPGADLLLVMGNQSVQTRYRNEKGKRHPHLPTNIIYIGTDHLISPMNVAYKYHWGLSDKFQKISDSAATNPDLAELRCLNLYYHAVLYFKPGVINYDKDENEQSGHVIVFTKSLRDLKEFDNVDIAQYYFEQLANRLKAWGYLSDALRVWAFSPKGHDLPAILNRLAQLVVNETDSPPKS
jgi:hypothetical protein